MRARNSGLQGQIESFFRENPDEYLEREDICIKWGVTRRQVKDALGHIKKKGAIEEIGGLVVKALK